MIYKTHNRGLIGFGILYLLIQIPFVWWVKIGITAPHIGAGKRARQVGRAHFGFPVPIFFVPIPFCYQVEQFLHRMFAGLNCVWYKGDGHKEYFWFPVVAFVLPIMAAVWFFYAWVVVFAVGGDFSAVVSRLFVFLTSLYGNP